jgi:hypothetical protein
MQDWIQENPKKTSKILITLTLTTTTILTLSIIPTNQLPVDDLLQKQDLSEDLVLHYTFDNADIDRKIIDQSGNNHTGIINGEPSFVKTGNSLALKLDGKKDYIQIKNFTPPTKKGTILANVKINNLSKNSHIIHTGNGDGWGTQQEIHLSTSNNKITAYLGSTNSNGNQYSIRSPIEKNSFQTSMTYENNNSLRLYQDGQLKNEEKGSYIETDKWPQTTFIGKPNADKRYFQGEIKEIRIYDRKLTEPELRAVNNNKQAIYLNFRNNKLNLLILIVLLSIVTFWRRKT